MTRKESDFVRGKKKGRTEAFSEAILLVDYYLKDNTWNVSAKELKKKLKDLAGKSLVENKE